MTADAGSLVGRVRRRLGSRSGVADRLRQTLGLAAGGGATEADDADRLLGRLELLRALVPEIGGRVAPSEYLERAANGGEGGTDSVSWPGGLRVASGGC